MMIGHHHADDDYDHYCSSLGILLASAPEGESFWTQRLKAQTDFLIE